MSFCVTGVAQRDILTFFLIMRRNWLCDRHSTFASFFEGELHLLWQALWRPPSFFWVAGATLYGRVVLCVSCKSQCQGGATSWQRANAVAGVGHCEISILRGRRGHTTLYTLYFTLDTLQHSTVHFTLHTPHFKLHFTLHTVHWTVHTLHFTVHTLQLTLCSLHFTFLLHTFHFTLYTWQATLYTLHPTMYTLDSTFYMWHSIFLQFRPHALHCTLDTPHPTLYTLHSTFYTLNSTLYTLHSTRTIWTSLMHVWAFGFVNFIFFGCMLWHFLPYPSWFGGIRCRLLLCW